MCELLCSANCSSATAFPSCCNPSSKLRWTLIRLDGQSLFLLNANLPICASSIGCSSRPIMGSGICRAYFPWATFASNLEVGCESLQSQGVLCSTVFFRRLIAPAVVVLWPVFFWVVMQFCLTGKRRTPTAPLLCLVQNLTVSWPHSVEFFAIYSHVYYFLDANHN